MTAITGPKLFLVFANLVLRLHKQISFIVDITNTHTQTLSMKARGALSINREGAPAVMSQVMHI